MKIKKEKFNFYILLSCILSSTLMAHPQAETTFTGSAEGIFVEPVGGSVYSGVGTNYFRYGEASTSQNSLEFIGKSFNVTTPTGYIIGKNAQERRPLFSIGTLTYHNGSTRGGNPSGVQLTTNIQLSSPVSAGPVDIPASLTFNITTNTGNPEESADYVYLPKSFSPVVLTTSGGAPITIYPYGFGNASTNGFTRLDKFFVYEEETASADLLAKITSPCESIVNGAVKTWISDHINDDDTIAKNAAMNASFIPRFNLSIDEAAKLCGYDHFNWVQYVLDDPKAGMYAANNPAKLLKGPFLDPPIGGYTTLIDDTLPYYWGENSPTAHEIQKNTFKSRLEFYDAPEDKDLQGNETVKFIIGLVGVLKNDDYDMLYVWEWKSNYNGHTGTAHFKNISYLTPGGTGGVSITKVDLTAEEIPLSVRQQMQKDGARNVETYSDLLPVPLLIPVLFD